MPSHVKFFFGIVIVFVFYRILSTVWGLFSFASLMSHSGRPIGNGIIFIRIVATTFECVIYLTLAWLAAFHRKDWARWVFAAIVIGAPIFLLWPFLYLSGDFRQQALRAYFTSLTSPRSLAAELLEIAAIIFVFTGNARAWFKPSAIAV